MATDFAVKYAAQVDERFTLASLTECAVNQEYDFVGVKTVRVYHVATADMNDYASAGLSRYGTPVELQASVQELTVERDRSFTFTIDKRGALDTMGALAAGRALARQIDEKVIPEVDRYRLGVMAASAGKTETGALTDSTAYPAFLDATLYLAEKNVPPEQRVAFVSPAFYKAIKLDAGFVRSGDIAQELLVRGQVGMIDGVSVVLTPASYLPDGVQFLVTHPSVTVGAQKLAEYKVHDNPPGLNGWLVEGRVCYDAFVLGSRADGIYVHTL